MANAFSTYRAGLNPINYYGGGSLMGRVGGGGSGGGTAYGGIPAPIALPPSRYAQAGAAIPNFANLTAGASGIVGSEQSGQVSQNTRNALTTAAAERGVARGMPGAQDFTNNDLFANIAGYSENRQRQGLQDYQSLLAGTEAGQNDPALGVQVEDRNALYAASPDPALAAQQQLANYMSALTAARGPAGGTGARSNFNIPTFGQRGMTGSTQSAGVWRPPNMSGTPAGWTGTATSGSITDTPIIGGPPNYSGGFYQGNGLYGGTGYRSGPQGAPNPATLGRPAIYSGPGGVDAETQAYYNWLDQQSSGNSYMVSPTPYPGSYQGPEQGTGE